MAIPLPPLNLNSNATSSAKGDANFGGDAGFSVNYGTTSTGTPPWVWLVAAVAALIVARKLHKA